MSILFCFLIRAEYNPFPSHNLSRGDTLKKLISLLLIPFLLLALSSCSQKDASAEELFDVIYFSLSPAPDGILYLSHSDEGTRHYMSSALFSTVYGAIEENVIEEYAIYHTSFAIPFEIAVFKCYSPSDVDRVEALCLARLDLLLRHYKGTSYESAIRSASILHKGRFVAMLICTERADTDAILHRALNHKSPTIQ